MAAPSGFQRHNNGWLEAAPDPKKKAIHKIKEENAALKDRLAQLEAAVDSLVNKKGKK
jgi:hypothetical protein